jgi:putative CocE/NonD family hydrolase
LLCGRTHGFWQEWVEHDRPGDEWWSPGDNSDVSAVKAPIHLISGWYDFACLPLIRDYEALRKAGQAPYLTIGPWTHFASEAAFLYVREGLIWLRAHMLGDRRGLREAPVRIFVMGAANEWREYPAWPPATMVQQRWYLQPGRGFAATLPAASEPDHYRYDPADPTPSLGGTVTSGVGKPVFDNRALESRPDVLTYTSDALDEPMELIGPVSAELYVGSSVEHTDFFVRVCDVDPAGRSLNVCDGLQRLFPGRPAPQPDGTIKVTISLWPTAYRFARGHRLRIQVSSGAFPRWNRNLGTGESLATATKMRVAEQRVFHDPAHPSAVILPVVGQGA